MARDIRTRLQGSTDRVQHQRRIWAVPSQTFSALKMQSALKSWHAQQAKMCFPQALRSLCTACFVAWAHWIGRRHGQKCRAVAKKPKSPKVQSKLLDSPTFRECLDMAPLSSEMGGAGARV